MRDVRDGQRRVRRRLEEVEMGGVSRKERRMRLFSKLVARVLKGGCILCFWLGNKEGWLEENCHLWDECGWFRDQAVDVLLELVNKLGKVGRDWSKRENSGCNWCWLPKCLCNTWVENKRGSWMSRRKISRKGVYCNVRWMDVVGLGILMEYINRRGLDGKDMDGREMIVEWLDRRAGVDKNGVDGDEYGRLVKEWLVKRQL